MAHLAEVEKARQMTDYLILGIGFCVGVGAVAMILLRDRWIHRHDSAERPHILPGPDQIDVPDCPSLQRPTRQQNL